MTTALQTKIKGLEVVLTKNIKGIQSVLPKNMDAKRFCRIAINAAIKNPALTECNPDTFAMSVLNCAEMGLEPALSEAALIPYKGKVQCQPQYQGLVKLCMNSGQIKVPPFAEVVLEGEEFQVVEGFEPSFTHVKDDTRDRDKNESEFLAAYAGAVLMTGARMFVKLTRKEVENRRNVSPGWKHKDSPWQNWPGPQWKKTAIKALTKKLPKSVQLVRALALDDQADMNITQTPALVDFADMAIDIDAIAGEPDDGSPKIAEPQRKSEQDAKKETTTPQSDDAVIDEVKALQPKAAAGPWKRAWTEAGLEEGEAPEMADVDKLKAFLVLFKAAV